jgi:hypothetical protein
VVQRIKTTKILKGDNNTKYFQMIANGTKDEDLSAQARGRSSGG